MPLAAVLAACSGGGGGNAAEQGFAAAPPRLSNAAPLIAGSPAITVLVGTTYSFLPSAGDNEGDSLVFGIDSKPPWVSFNATTGQLSGTPTLADVGVYRGIVVWVSDGPSRTALAPFDLTVVAPPTVNRAPQIAGTPPGAVVAGRAYSFTPTASDPDGTPLTFTVRNPPPWASFDAATGRLAGTPPLASAGAFADIVISATDGAATVSLPGFSVVVTAPPPINRPPAITGTPPSSVEEGRSYTFIPTASDPDAGDTLTFMVQNLPAWASFNAGSGFLSGTPPAPGSFPNIIVTVDDGQASASLPAFTIDVTAATANRTPVIGGAPATDVPKGSPYSFQPTASDADHDALTFSIANRPSWATFDSATGLLQGTPAAVDAGVHDNIVISVTDTHNASAALPPFSILVSNRAPTISGTPPATVVVGTPYSFTPTASDPDPGDTLTFAIQNAPAWASFDSATGRLYGTPAIGDVATTSGIVISASDGTASTPLAAFSIVVSNRAPTISGAPTTTVNVGTPYSFTPTASDPDLGDTLTFTVQNRPAWATFDSMTGALQGTPAIGDVGTTSGIVIGVSDANNATAALAAFSIVVSNRAPTISGAPTTTVTIGTAYSFTPTASDPDPGDTLTFTIQNRPTWATFDSATGTLSGTPAVANVGTTSGIVIGVRDANNATAALAAFAIVVSNRAPTISGTPATTGMVGSPYSFTPTASDPDPGDTLTFTIQNRPVWATFDSTTGRLYGTPAIGNIGTTSGIVIGVRDANNATATLGAFAIVVSNGAPTISGIPATTATVGTQYSFTPSANDPDIGDTLTFTIVNRPAWATFNPATGTLQGMPAIGDVGTTIGIVIGVRDAANATAALAAFSITVQSNQTGTALLTWVPPTQNTDASPLTNLAGYKVYWGTSPGTYTNNVTVDQAGIASYLVENLAPNTYYFVVTARNAVGGESVYSNVATKTIQ